MIFSHGHKRVGCKRRNFQEHIDIEDVACNRDTQKSCDEQDLRDFSAEEFVKAVFEGET